MLDLMDLLLLLAFFLLFQFALQAFLSSYLLSFLVLIILFDDRVLVGLVAMFSHINSRLIYKYYH